MARYLNVNLASEALLQISQALEKHKNIIKTWRLEDNQKSKELLMTLLLYNSKGNMEENYYLCKSMSEWLCAEVSLTEADDLHEDFVDFEPKKNNDDFPF